MEPDGEILAAVDGSEHSDKIVDEACSLAKKMNAKLALIYVTPDIVVPEAYKKYSEIEKTDAWLGYFDALGEKVLSKYNKKILDSKLICEIVHEEGNVAERIINTAKSRKDMMILIGLSGLHGVAKIRALGSTSRIVVENAECPVLVYLSSTRKLIMKIIQSF